MAMVKVKMILIILTLFSVASAGEIPPIVSTSMVIRVIIPLAIGLLTILSIVFLLLYCYCRRQRQSERVRLIYN